MPFYFLYIIYLNCRISGLQLCKTVIFTESTGIFLQEVQMWFILILAGSKHNTRTWYCAQLVWEAVNSRSERNLTLVYSQGISKIKAVLYESSTGLTCELANKVCVCAWLKL